MREHPGKGSEPDQEPDPEPDAEPRPERPPASRQRQPPAPAAREQVDRSDEEGDQGRQQDELDCPAPDDPAPQVDVPCRASRELDAAVE